MRRGQKEFWVTAADTSYGLHVPNMIFLGVHHSFRRKKVKRRKTQVVKRSNGPAILAIRRNVLLGHLQSLAITLHERRDIGVARGGSFQSGKRIRQGGTSGSPGRSVLKAQQFLC